MSIIEKRFYLPTEVVFGKGSLDSLKRVVNKNDRVFLVTDPGIEKAGILKSILKHLESVGPEITVFNQAEPNPTAELVNKVMEDLRNASATMVIAVGGGSSMDIGKIIAALATNDGTLCDYQWNGLNFAHEALPFIAIPTTAGTGSEVTRCAVIVDRNTKKGIDSDKLFPKLSIVDPELMLGLPSRLTASTGMDALAHAVEAYVGQNASPFTDALALEAVRLINKSLQRACSCGTDIEAREDMALASTLAGVAMDQGGLGIVHSIASPICCTYHLSHGDASAILLKYGMQFNLKAVPNRFAKLAEAFGCDIKGLRLEEAGALAVQAVSDLLDKTGLKVDLAAYGLKETDADTVAEQTLKMFLLKNNPFCPSQEEIKQLYLDILKGENV